VTPYTSLFVRCLKNATKITATAIDAKAEAASIVTPAATVAAAMTVVGATATAHLLQPLNTRESGGEQTGRSRSIQRKD